MKFLEISAKHSNKLSYTLVFARVHSMTIIVTQMDKYHLILIRQTKYYAKTLAQQSCGVGLIPIWKSRKERLGRVTVSATRILVSSDFQYYVHVLL